MINKDENKPIYKQLVDEILEDIKNLLTMGSSK